jgi:4-amino-4-deoxy-L-arabinose transferase-like glycosyltransferase
MWASIGNLKASGVPVGADSAARWRTAFWVVWAVVLGAKILLAATLAPFGDEAWYWQESQHLAVGYSDLPPATAWLIRFGEICCGHGVLAMRAPFLLLGALLPLLVVRLGRGTFDANVGWCAGLLALGLPLLGTLGAFALPDAPLMFVSALALERLEKAAREQRIRDWSLLGLALACAWLVHYRAAMLLCTGGVFFVVTPRGRALLRSPGPWLAAGISLLGLIPIVLFNAQQQWIGLGFQFIDRHPWAFHADALVQPLEQAAVCTPLFYLFLLWALWQALKRMRSGTPWDLLAICAGVPIVAYFVLGLFADDTRFRVHWPLPGYLPLLVALPVLLRECWSSRGGRLLTRVALAMLWLGNCIAFAYLAAAAVPGGATALASLKAFPEHWVGWDEVAQETRKILAQPQYDGAVLVADNFMLAAELDFALDDQRPIYALDQPINTKHGRAPQLALWQRDEAALHTVGSRQVLLVAEPTARRERERGTWMQSLCARVADLTPVTNLDLYDGRKRYRWYRGALPVGAAATTTDCVATP